MLDVNTLPKRYRKVEEFENFDECYSQLRFRSKRTEEGRQKYFKTNVCEKRWRVTWCGVSLLLTFILIQLARRPTDVQTADRDISKPSGDTHKILKMSYLRTKRRRFSDFQTDWLSNSDEQQMKLIRCR